MAENEFYNLYDRLPEIYRIKDADLPASFLRDGVAVEALQLKSYLAPIEEMFGAIHENIESLYHDFFVETADDWVIPYLADLLGTSHLSGEAWTLRADVADTIALRRRKGTLGAIELLTYNLTRWGVHSIELRENLVWNQHLNHQRPETGGAPPYASQAVKRSAPVRGGTVNLRDPSLLALLETPFDSFAHVVDVKPPATGRISYNLPNLAIFLWRLKDFQVRVSRPFARLMPKLIGAPHTVRVNVNPIPVNQLSAPYVEPANKPEGQPVRLFNTNRLDLFNRRRTGTDKLNLSAIAPRISNPDQVPAPIPVERISDYEIAAEYDAALAEPVHTPFEAFAESSFTAPHEYIAVETYDKANLQTLNVSDVGFQLHLPEPDFPPDRIWLHRKLPRAWKIRGENLCAWEKGLKPSLAENEIAVDPVRGRVVIGADSKPLGEALARDLLVTYTYGAVGEVGAHPISYPALPKELDKAQTPAVNFYSVNFRQNANGLRDALIGISTRTAPTVIEITDSFTHSLNLKDSLLIADIENESGFISLKLNAPLVIRAADDQRPIVELARPLAFRPTNVAGANETEQKKFDAVMNNLFVRLEGLFLARGLNYASYRRTADEKKNEPLIARAALNKLEILNCTLDPGGFIKYKGTRAPLLPSIRLSEPYGFAKAPEENEFKQTPEIIVQRSICGAIFTDAGYRLCLADSIVDAGQGVNDKLEVFAVSGATDPAGGYAAQTTISNTTVFGRMRAATIEGSGAIFVHALEAENQQIGCLKYCYFADEAKNRLPQNHACVSGKTAKLIFTSEFFGAAAYGQLSLQCDRRILEEGANNDQMGAFNFLLEAHKWRNLRIRFREFMPIGVRPLLIPVT